MVRYALGDAPRPPKRLHRVEIRSDFLGLRLTAGDRALLFWHTDTLIELDPQTGAVMRRWTVPSSSSQSPAAVFDARLDGPRIWVTTTERRIMRGSGDGPLNEVAQWPADDSTPDRDGPGQISLLSEDRIAFVARNLARVEIYQRKTMAPVRTIDIREGPGYPTLFFAPQRDRLFMSTYYSPPRTGVDIYAGVFVWDTSTGARLPQLGVRRSLLGIDGQGSPLSYDRRHRQIIVWDAAKSAWQPKFSVPKNFNRLVLANSGRSAALFGEYIDPYRGTQTMRNVYLKPLDR